MYCPKCAAQNLDDAKFCRACGANLALVPQALTGSLPPVPPAARHGKHKGKKPPSVEEAIMNTFLGVGFVLVAFGALLFAPAGRIWWFWLLIPAFAMMGRGLAEFVSLKYGQRLTPNARQDELPPAHQTNELPLPDRFEAFPPPSVTEGTTRHLDPAEEKRRNTR